jgi:hypothetical protein
MSFLHNNPNLCGTIFTDSNLVWARRVLAGAIQRSEPGWLGNPRGYLKQLWERDDPHSVCTLFRELERNVTSQSRSILNNKFRQLLQAQTKRRFDEIYMELQAAAFLSVWVTPVALEPALVSYPNIPGQRGRNPDISVRLPGDEHGMVDVVFEVTANYFGTLDDWGRSVELRDGLRYTCGLFLTFYLSVWDLGSGSPRKSSSESESWKFSRQ